MSKNIVRIHRPNLTPEERARRMKQIERAAADLLLEVARKEQRKREEQERAQAELGTTGTADQRGPI